jgi:hypothetical protein
MNRTVGYRTGPLSSMGSLSESDIFGLYGGSPPQSEKRLMFAVLLDAVECFQKYAGHEVNRLFKDTENWIFQDDPDWPFSFINICEAVEMDPQWLRKGLSQWKQKTIPRPNARTSQTIVTRAGDRRRALRKYSRCPIRPVDVHSGQHAAAKVRVFP